MAIALASLAKLTPALLLLPFLARRQWSALAGFGLVWAGALAMVFSLDRRAFSAYLAAQHVMTGKTIARLDNGAFVPELARMAGSVGGILGLGVLAGTALLLLRRHTTDGEAWSAWE
jgi:hypothetical protein